jgi:hypothetical protein
MAIMVISFSLMQGGCEQDYRVVGKQFIPTAKAKQAPVFFAANVTKYRPKN